MSNQVKDNNGKVKQVQKSSIQLEKDRSEAEAKKLKELEAALQEKKEIEMYNLGDHKNRKKSLFAGNWLSKFFMINLSKVVDAGMQQPFKFFMLYFLPKEFTYEGDYKNFERFYMEQRNKTEAAGKKFDFLELIFDYLGSRYQWGAFLSGLRMLLEVLFPIFLKEFLKWLPNKQAPDSTGYLWAMGLVLVVIFKAFISLWGYYHLELCTLKVKNVVRAKVINNVCSISPGARKYIDVAKVTNYMMVDLSKITMFTLTRPTLLYTPFAAIGLLILVIIEVKWVVVLMVAVVLLGLGLQMKLNLRFKGVNIQRMGIADKRGKKISEIMSGVKAIKFNAWEKIMDKMIQEFRKHETALIKTTFLLQGLSSSISTLMPMLFGIVVFTVYDATFETKLSVAQIYSLISLFNAFISPIRFYMMTLLNRADSQAGAERINLLFSVDSVGPMPDDPQLPSGSIEITNADFNWEEARYYKIFERKELEKKDQSLKILQDISLRVQPGEFLAIVGKVGSGKSSILLAAMNEMVKSKGEVRKHGKIAFIQQEAFLLNDTIKDNILFGEPYEEVWFDKVVDICQLRPDLETLAAGVLTEIGEKGINLSGGQKQRISIARAVYSRSDIYLIDDSLSALDAYVGKKIMEEVFNGVLRGKTRVMVTHYLNVLEDETVISRVVLMKDGKIIKNGRYSEIRQTPEWKEFSDSSQNGLGKGEEEKGKTSSQDTKIDSLNGVKGAEEVDQIPSSRYNFKIGNKPNIKANEGEDPEADPLADDKNVEKKGPNRDQGTKLLEEELKKKGELTISEKRESGVVGSAVYGYYMKNAGVLNSVFVLLMYILTVFGTYVVNYWVGAWMQDTLKLSRTAYILIYIGLGVATCIIAVLQALLLGVVSKNAAFKIYQTINWNILRRPMRFFDTTPSGVILNRCINDVSQLDFQIPFVLGFFLSTFITTIVILIMTSILTPVVIVAVFVSFFYIIVLFKRFVYVGTELKRLTQISSSPMISLASELIQGVVTVRNYGKLQSMLDKYVERADRHHTCDIHEQILSLWMRSKMEWASCFITAVGIFSIALNKNYRILSTQDESASGLIISYLLSLGSMVSAILFSSSQLAKGAVSIERLREYALWEDHERDFDLPEPAKKENWPEVGVIEGKNVTTRYRRGLKRVLDGVDFKIEAGQKVAIVGRTGSGKSTLLLSLMRILEMEQEGDEKLQDDREQSGKKQKESSGKPVGQILIDGQDIEKIGLHHLRRNLAIIPQEPFLLQGDLRFNVDPFNKFTDEQIINALKSVSVLDTIRDEDIVDQKIKQLKEKQKPKGPPQPGPAKPEGPSIALDDDPEVQRIRKSGATVEDKLKYEIATGGNNLSLGQRQLICIARTILVPPKILLMDEATANIDQKTDSVIQSLIKEKLKGTTVVTIAHRLITICQYDKIIVLDSGRKKQEGSVLQLLGEPEEEGGYIDKSKYDGSGLFANLVNEGGKEFRQKMIYCARNKHLNPSEIFG